jgi:hypothetical protein
LATISSGLGFFWSLPLPSNRLENPLQKEPLLREKTSKPPGSRHRATQAVQVLLESEAEAL